MTFTADRPCQSALISTLIDAGNTGGGFGIPTYIAGEPRFYGVELGAKF
ncbi:hypothetical protein [Sphingomonas paucimobilis]|mgnify:CR=1 FL=1